MRVSFSLFGMEPSDYVPIVQAADQAGFDTVWLAEHLITPAEFDSAFPYDDRGSAPFEVDTPLVDVWSLLGALSHGTQRVRLGTGIYILPLRSPFVTARAAATVQQLSNGRFVLGVGAGWLRAEFDAVGVPFDDRGKRMDETILALRALWGSQPSSFHGDLVRFRDVVFAPEPRERIPMLVGGSSPPALRRAASLADGWYGTDCSLEASIAVRDQLERLREEAGRGDEPFELVVRLQGKPTPRLLDDYAAAGFGHVSLRLDRARRPGEGLEQTVTRLGAELGLDNGGS